MLLMLVKDQTLMGRRIPIFKVVLKNGASYEQIKEHPEIKAIILEELIIAIEDGLKKDKKKVTLFQIGDSEFEVELPRTQWKRSLTHAMENYIDNENYPQCVRIRDLIAKL